MTKNPLKRYVTNVLFICVFIVIVLLRAEICLALYAIAINVFLLIRVAKSRYLMFFYALQFFFSLNFIYPMFIDTANIIYVNDLYMTDIKFKTLITYCLFILASYLFIKPTKNIEWKYQTNNIAYCMFVAMHILALIFGINRTQNDGTYIVRINTFYELIYFYVFFQIIYSGGDKKKLALTFALSCIAIIQDLYYDGRITSLQILLVVFICYYKKFPLKLLIPTILILLIIFIYIGNTRVNADYEFDLVDNLLKIDTFYFAFQASETHVYVYDYIDLGTRLNSLLGNLLNTIFIDNGAVYNVSAITHEYVNHYYGGYIFTWFYFWGGYVGSFFIGWLVTYIINHNIKRNKSLNSYILILCFATMPRWFIYEPTILFKYAMLSTILVHLIFNSLKMPALKRPLEKRVCTK